MKKNIPLFIGYCIAAMQFSMAQVDITLDTDRDGVFDHIDHFPNDASKWIDDATIHDNADMLNAIHLIFKNTIDKQIGKGIYQVQSNEPYYQEYSNTVNYSINRANQTITAVNNFGIITDSNGNITDAKTFDEIESSYLSRQIYIDFYYVSLAVLYDNSKAETLIKYIKWLEWQNLKSTDLDVSYHTVFGRATLMAWDYLNDDEKNYLKSILWNISSSKGNAISLIQYAKNPISIFNSADTFRMEFMYLLAAIKSLPETNKAQRETKLYYMSELKKSLEIACTPIDGQKAFIKPDFTVNHHYATYVSGYGPQGLFVLANLAETFSHTAYKFSKNALINLNKTAENLYFMAHTDYVPLGISGRLKAPDNTMLDQTFLTLPLLLATDTEINPKLAQVFINTKAAVDTPTYNPVSRLHQRGVPGHLACVSKTLVKLKNQYTPKIIEGTRVFPYTPALAYRKNNWSAFVKGNNKYWWSYEGGISATNRQNITGIYYSMGGLELMYKDPASPIFGKTVNSYNKNGFEFSHLPGTTVPFRTHLEMASDIIVSRLKINSTTVGGGHLENNIGVYIYDFKNAPSQMVDESLEFKKSYYFLGDKIILLGSNINYDNDNYPIHTTLFQTHLDQENRKNTPIFVNSNIPITADSYSFEKDLSESGILLDSDGTGYYVSDGKIVVERKLSVEWLSRTLDKTASVQENINAIANDPKVAAYKASAWIDHGKNPSDAKYEYTVLPNKTFNEIEDFKQQQDNGEIYEVIQQDSQAHIIHDKELNVWAYAIFEDISNKQEGILNSIQIENITDETISANPGYIVIVKELANKIQLSVTYLDLRLFSAFKATYDGGGENDISKPVTLQLALNGTLQIDANQANVDIVKTESNKTFFNINCSHGTSQTFETTKDTVSTPKTALDKIRVYPNPIGEQLIVKKESGIINGGIYNLTGKCLINISGEFTNTTSLLPGMYLLKVGTYQQILIKK